ncbi:MAG: hypothetical protein QW728_01515, partial [Thermoplasmata archaeon]
MSKDTKKQGLAIAKQFEMLAKENQRKQKEAGDLINSVSKTIKDLASLGVELKSAESLLSHAKNTMKGGDYTKTIELCKECQTLIENTKKEFLEKRLGLLSQKIELLERLGAEQEPFQAKLREIKNKASSLPFEKLLSEVNLYEVDLENKMQQQVLDALKYAEFLIAEAKKEGTEVSQALHSLEKAKKLFETKNYKDAIDIALRCDAEIGMKLEVSPEEVALLQEQKVKEMMDQAQVKIALLKKAGIDVSSFEYQYDEAKTSLSKNDFQDTQDIINLLMPSVDEACIGFTTEKFRLIQDIISRLEAKRLPAGDLKDALATVQKAMDSKDYKTMVDTSLELARSAESRMKTVSKAEEVYQNADLKRKLLKKINLDKPELDKIYSELLKAYQENAFEVVLETGKKYSEAVDPVLSDVIQNQSRTFQTRLNNASRTSIDLNEVKELFKESKVAFESKEYIKSYDFIEKAAARLGKAAVEYIKNELVSINNILKLITGDDAARLNDIVSQIQSALSSDDWNSALLLVFEAKNITQKAQSGVITATLLQFEENIALGKKLELPLDDENETYLKAKAALNEGRLDLIDVLLKDKPLRLKQKLKEALHLQEEEAKLRMDALAVWGVDSERFASAYQKSKTDLNEDRIKEAYQGYKELLDRISKTEYDLANEALLSVQSLITMGQSVNADVSKVKAVLEDAEALFESKQYNHCIEKSKKAAEEAAKVLSVAIETALTKIKEIIKKFKVYKVDLKDVESLIATSGTSLVGKKYEESITTMKKAEGELSRMGAQLAQASFNQFQEALNQAKKTGTRIEPYTKILEEAKSHLDKGNFVEVLDITKQAQDLLNKKQTDVINERIAEVEGILKSIEAEGVKIVKARKIFENAKATLESNDFIKAAELIKECENTARTCKDLYLKATESLDAARKRISVLKLLSLDARELEDLAEVANNAFSAGNYEDAVEFSSQIRVEGTTLIEKKLKEDMNGLKNELAQLEKQGMDTSGYNQQVTQIEESIVKEAFEEAFNHINRILSELTGTKDIFLKAMESIKKAESELASAESFGVDVSKLREELQQIRELLNQKDYRKVIEAANSYITKIEHAIRLHAIDAVRASSQVLKDAESMGADTKQSMKIIQRAEEMLQVKDYVRALELAKQSVEMAKSIKEGAQNALDAILSAQRRISEASNIGLDVRNLQKELAQAKQHLNDNEFDKALEIAARVADRAEKIKTGAVRANTVIQQAKSKMAAAAKMGIELPDAKKMMDTAMMFYGNDEYEKAVEQALSLIEAIEKAQHEIVLKVIGAARTLVTNADSIGASVEKAEALVKKAEEALNEKKYDNALTLSKQSVIVAKDIIKMYQAALEAFGQAETLVGEIESLKIEHNAINDLLEKAREAMEKHEYEGAIRISSKVREDGKTLLSKVFAELVNNANKLIGEATSQGLELTEIKTNLDQATAEFEGGNLTKGISGVRGIISQIEERKAQLQTAMDSLELCKFRISEAKRYGVKTDELEEFLTQGQDFIEIGEYSKSVDEFNKLLASADELIRNSIREKLELAGKEIEFSAELGTDVTEMKRLYNEANDFLATNMYDNALASVQHILEIAGTENYKNLSEKILKCQSSIAEAQKSGADTRNAKNILKQAKSAVEAKDFRIAFKYVSQVQDDINASFLNHVNSLITEAENAIITSKELGVEVSKLKEMLDEAKEQVSEKEYGVAVELALDIVETTHKEQRALLEKELKNLHDKIAAARNMKLDISMFEESSSKAKSLLEEERYHESLQIIRNTLSSVMELQVKTIEKKLSSVEDKLEQARNIKIDVSKIEPLVLNAREALEISEYEVAYSLVEQIEEDVKNLLHSTINDKLISVQADIKNALNFKINVEQFNDMCEIAKVSFENGEYKQSHDLLIQISEDIRKAQEKELTKSIADARRLSAVASNFKLEVPEAIALISEADVHLGKKEFLEGWDKVVTAIDLIKSKLGDMFIALNSRVEEVLSNTSLMDVNVSKETAIRQDAVNKVAAGLYEDAYKIFNDLIESQLQIQQKRMAELLGMIEKEIELHKKMG